MKKIWIGIDVGGTKIKGVALSSLRSAPERSFVARLPRTFKKFLGVLQHETDVLAGNDLPAGIGLGLPGTLDYKRGILIHARNIPFIKNWNARKFFAQFRAPVEMDNDSRCFVRAEAMRGAGRGYNNIVGIAIGTGIGGGILTNGAMYYGAHGRAGELGRMAIDGKKTFEQLGAKRAFLKSGNTSKIIGVGVANIINILDPDVVILGGGGGLSKDVNLKTVRTVAGSYVTRSLRGKTPIVKAELGDFASAIGAALLFRTDT